MRILITNITLASRSGTEINVRDIALGLLARGHTPVVYSPELGELADELRVRTVPVVDDLDHVGAPPDVIHGHHHPETMMALLRFPGVPAIFFSHDFVGWQDAAPRFPRILRYVAVDEANRDRLVLAHAVPAERVRVVLNAVDLARFVPRPPLPARPCRALVFSNYAGTHPHGLVVAEACRRAGLPVDVVGEGTNALSRTPEAILGDYDLVFAKGRCALEALVVGCAVVLVDFSGSGPMVTEAAFERLRANNFGRRLLDRPLDPEVIGREIARYDPADAARVSQRVRETAGLALQLDTLEALYREVVTEQTALPDDPTAELVAASAYLRRWAPRLNERALWSELDRRGGLLAQTGAERDQARHERALAADESRRLDAEATRARAECQDLRAERDGLRAELQRVAAELSAAVDTYAVRARALEERVAGLAGERERLERELGSIRASTTWRLRERLVRLPALVGLYRTVRTLMAGGRGPATKRARYPA